MNIEQIKADREAGTQGPWHVEPVTDENGDHCFCDDMNKNAYAVCHPQTMCDATTVVGWIDQSNARRIARVPDLEDFAIEAMELLGRCLSQMECDWDVIDHDRGIGNTSIEEDKTIMAARAFLKKYNEPD